MKVHEFNLKLFLLQDIGYNDLQEKLTRYLDSYLAKESDFLNYHNEKNYKYYSFNSLYPLERDKVYKAGNIYTLTIRTIDECLAKYLSKGVANHYTKYMKGLTLEQRVIPKKLIEKIYSITPAIMKNDEGYWKGNLSVEEFEKRVKDNLVKKYKEFTNEEINEDFELYNLIVFKNQKPCSINYKGIKLLGDKLEITIGSDSIAQAIAYMALGTGILENNSRGMGFVNYRYI